MDELRPAAADHVRILRIELHRAVDAVCLLAGDQRAARAAKQIQHGLARFRRVENRLDRQRGRFLSRMHIFPRVVPFDVPDRRLAAVSEPLAVLALVASIENRLERIVVITVAEDHSLVPEQYLFGFQSGINDGVFKLQMIAAGIPDVERPLFPEARFQIFECGKQELRKFFPAQIVVFNDLPQTAARIVHSAITDSIRRIGENEIRFPAVHETGNVFRPGGIAAHEPVLAELIDHPRLTDRLFRDIRDGVGVRLSLGNHISFGSPVQQTVKLVGVEAEERQVKILFLQIAQFDRKKVVVPLRDLAGLVVRDPVCLHLFRREVFRDHHRYFREAELFRRFQPCVADNHNEILVHDNRLLEAELLNRVGNRLHRTVVEARVLLIRMDLREFHVDDLHLFLSFLLVVCN